jgi:hypothetical protein
MYCNKCGKPIPDGSVFCNACGSKQAQPVQNNPQPQPQYRQAPPPQQKPAAMPKSYYVDSWLLFGLCLAYGIVRGLIGFFNASERDMYKGFIACCAALVFIPQIKVVNNATATLIIKLVIAIGAVILI